MIKRPIAVTAIAALLIVFGVFGFVAHLREVVAQRPFQIEAIGIPILSSLAAVAGIFALLGRNWARWLAVTWMAFHVVISFFDSLTKVVVHVLLLILIAYALFGGRAKQYFAPDRSR